MDDCKRKQIEILRMNLWYYKEKIRKIEEEIERLEGD